MKKTVLIGMPNTGKSTFFNKISGASARVGNWPGITVDLSSIKTLINGEMTELIDLPGIYNLNGYSEDEEVVINFIDNNKIDQVFFIMNSTQIDRQLPLAISIQKLGVPVIILANMIDEAKALGITFDFEQMTKLLGCPVLPISAKYGQGLEKINNTINAPKKIKADLQAIDEQLLSQKIFDKTVNMPLILNDKKTKLLDSIFLHPFFGIPIFLTIIFSLFQFIYTLGAPIQEYMGDFFSYLQINYLKDLSANLPPLLKSFLFDGLYAGFTTVAAFVPIIIIFFFVDLHFCFQSGYYF